MIDTLERHVESIVEDTNSDNAHLGHQCLVHLCQFAVISVV